MNDLQQYPNKQYEPTRGFDFTPHSIEQAMQYAKMIADSELAPKDYRGKPGNVIVAIQMGADLGLKPMQAIQNISIINGRCSLWGDAMLGVVKAHPEFENIIEYVENGVATCTVYRHNQDPHTQTFSMEDAKKAGLSGKAGPWTQYPNRMLQMRARSFALRNTFPDALRGIHMVEEARDLPREQSQRVTLAEIANKQLGISIQPSGVNYDGVFNYCQTVEELRESFDALKKKAKSKDELAQIVSAKDQRKNELEAIDVSSEVVTIIGSTANTQTNEEWLKDFAGDSTEEDKQIIEDLRS